MPKTSNFNNATYAPEDLENLTEREYQLNLYNELIDHIDENESTGVLNNEEADAYRIQALADLEERLLEAEGYDPSTLGEEYEDKEEEDEEYSSNALDLTNFSTGNDFGSAVLGLIEDEYASYDDGIATIAETAGITPDEVLGLLGGEYVPDEGLVDAIASCFDTVSSDENAYAGLHYLGEDARNEAFEDEGDSEEEEVEVEEPENSESGYSRIQELEDTIAEFQVSNAIKDELTSLEMEARSLVESQYMTPNEYQNLMANIGEVVDSEKIAMFSEVCSKNNVSPDVELYAMRKCIELAKRRGPIADFSTYATGPLTQEEVDIEAALEKQALLNYRLMKSS